MSTPPKPLESPVPDWPCWSAMYSHESHSLPKGLNTMSPAKPDDLLILKVHKEESEGNAIWTARFA